MSLLMKAAIVLVLGASASAKSCEAGSCTVDDQTSLVQTKTVMKHGFGDQPKAYAGTGDQATSESDQATSRSGAISAMQFSAHWKCFNEDFFGTTCAPKVKELLPGLLADYKLDFVNLGMFQAGDGSTSDWPPPANYAALDYRCSRDNIKFLYDKEKWVLTQTPPEVIEVTMYTEPNPTDVFGCSNKNKDGGADRVYGVLAFQSIENEASKIIVVVGHFPHPEGGTSSAENSNAENTKPLLIREMAPKIAYIKSQGGWEDAKILFIGDLNNNIDEIRNPAFDSAPGIEAALDVMNEQQAADLRNAKNVIRDEAGAPIDLPLSEALLEPNRGWITQPEMTSPQVWEALVSMAPGNPLVSATAPFGTCCADKPAMVDGSVAFPYTFDRLMASFGPLHTIMPMEVLLKSLEPGEARALIDIIYVGAFHMPIIATTDQTLKTYAIATKQR